MFLKQIFCYEHKYLKKLRKYFQLDPCHHFKSPGLSWNLIFKMTYDKLDITSDMDSHKDIVKQIVNIQNVIIKKKI